MAISGLYTALSGIHAHRQILDNASHNVANQLTPGYRRTLVDLAPVSAGTGAQVFAGQGTQELGVDVVDTRRVLNVMSESRARATLATAVDASTSHEAMLRLEHVFAEPGTNGIANQLDAFWVSWSDLATRAADPVARSEVLSQANGIIDRFQLASDDLRSVGYDAERRLATMSTEINTMAAQVADLNKSIAASPTTANALLDQRDALAAELETMAGVQIRPTERGQIAVSVGGRLLVGNGSSYDVRYAGGTIVWDVDGTQLQPTTSELSALNRLRDETLPDTLAALDTIVADFVTEVNTAHEAGYGLDGVTGRPFFDPAGTTAEALALSADVDGQPDHLAAGAPELPGPVAPGPHDGGQAQVIGDLAESGTSTADYRSFVADLGIRTNAAGRTADSSRLVADQALDDAESVSGVNLDEELAMMMAAQQGYEASARVLRAADEMLQTLMGLFR